MPDSKVESGFAEINGARLYYEMAGEGPGMVMIYAGPADSRQWNRDFANFAQYYRVLRYDMRAHGKSEPVEGDYSNLADLLALLDYVRFEQPAIFMGCSLGGTLSMDLALAEAARVKAIIMLGSGPGGLELDVAQPAEFAEAEKAQAAEDWDRLAELMVRIWFDGARQPDAVNPEMRRLAQAMSRQEMNHRLTGLGNRLPNIEPPAAERLHELAVPVLVIVGAYDTPFIQAADYMQQHIKSVTVAHMDDAAHMPNLDHPEAFQQIVEDFLADVVQP